MARQLQVKVRLPSDESKWYDILGNVAHRILVHAQGCEEFLDTGATGPDTAEYTVTLELEPKVLGRVRGR